MRRLSRCGVLALVLLLILGTMGTVLAEEPAEGTAEEATEKVVEPGSYLWEWADEMVSFVLYWGFGETPVEEVPGCESLADEEPSDAVDGEDGEETFFDCLPIKKPNHGSFVSSFVHWLKGGGQALLPDAYQSMPRGHLVKLAAHHEFGKGWMELPDPDAVVESLESAEDADGDDGGPPPWAKGKAKDKVKGPKNK